MGSRYAELNDDQKDMLRALVESYAVGHARRGRQGLARRDPRRGSRRHQVRLVRARAIARQPHAYRVQGPTFLIEFNNTQNNANHIHSVWRNMLGDFGVPLASK